MCVYVCVCEFVCVCLSTISYVLDYIAICLWIVGFNIGMKLNFVVKWWPLLWHIYVFAFEFFLPDDGQMNGRNMS